MWGFPCVQGPGHLQAAWAIWEDCCALTPTGVLSAHAHQKGLQLPALSQAGKAFGTCFVENQLVYEVGKSCQCLSGQGAAHIYSPGLIHTALSQLCDGDSTAAS